MSQIDPEKRDALRGVVLWAAAHTPSSEYIDRATDEIVGLVESAGGVTFTPDEVSAVISGLRWASLHPTDGAPATWGSRWRSIADRLEASI